MIVFNSTEFCNNCPHFNVDMITENLTVGFVPTVPTFTVQCEHYSLCKKITEMCEEKYGIERGEL